MEKRNRFRKRKNNRNEEKLKQIQTKGVYNVLQFHSVQ